MFSEKIFAAFGFASLLICVTGTASASVLTLKPGTQSIEGVPLATEATLDSVGKKVTLKPYLKGLRRKKVAIFWAKVYVGQIFAGEGLATPPKTIPEAMEALSTQPVVAISMSFLRDVNVSRMKDAFSDALRTNSIDPDSETMKPLFQVVEKSGGMKDGETTNLILERTPDGKESFRFEAGKGETQAANVEPGTLKKILSLWVGKPADSGMEQMHDQFLGVKN